MKKSKIIKKFLVKNGLWVKPDLREKKAFFGKTILESDLSTLVLKSKLKHQKYFISLAKDFSTHPAGRTRLDGKFSGEAFREDVLLQNLKKAHNKGQALTIDLDHTHGLASSFLAAAFGGLITQNHLSQSEMAWLKFEGSTPPGRHYVEIAKRCILEASQQNQTRSFSI